MAIESLVQRLINFLEPFFSNFGYLIVFAGTFLESNFVTGWVAPGAVLLLLGSFYAAQGRLMVFWVGASALSGCLIGDTLGYHIGKASGTPLIKRLASRPRTRRGMEISLRYFERFGGVTVLFGRLLPGVDAFIPLTAGLHLMPYWKFLLYDTPAIIVYTIAFTSVGYFFGNRWMTIEMIINRVGWVILGLIAATMAIAYITRKIKRERGSDPDNKKRGSEETPKRKESSGTAADGS